MKKPKTTVRLAAYELDAIAAANAEQPTWEAVVAHAEQHKPGRRAQTVSFTEREWPRVWEASKERSRARDADRDRRDLMGFGANDEQKGAA